MPAAARGKHRSIAGGALAATSLATSALLTPTLTTDAAEPQSRGEALYRLMFATGGPIHGVGLGLLVGSLGLSALLVSGIAGVRLARPED
jgi:hypothetical protein